MPRYVKKPVIVEAVRVNPTDYNGTTWDGSPFSEIPDWLTAAFDAHTVWPDPGKETDYCSWKIGTLEGVMVASPGDYIIRGIQGELYPCKPDIFEATYEPVSEEAEGRIVAHCENYADAVRIAELLNSEEKN